MREFKGFVVGIVLSTLVIFCIGSVYSAGGDESLIQDTDNKTTKVCKQDCQERVYCDHQIWCNTLTEQGTCEYRKSN